jgi:antigen flippase
MLIKTMQNLSRLIRGLTGSSSVGGQVVLTSGTNAILMLLALFTGSLAARLLGSQGRGELAAIQTWPTFLGSMAMLGLPEALVYFSARDSAHTGRYLGSAIALTTLSSIPFIAVGYLLMPYLLAAQSTEVIAAARWYLMIVIPLFAWQSLSLHPLRGQQHFAIWNLLRTAPMFGWLFVLVIAWFLRKADPSFVALNYLIVLALLVVPYFYIVACKIGGSFWPLLRNFGPMLRYGLPSLASGIPQMFNLKLDQVLMAAFLPAKMLGLYVVAVAWAGASGPLINALAVVVFPHIASQDSFQQRVDAFARSIRLGIMVSITMATFLMFLTPWTLPFLFGAEFSLAIPAALILVVAGAIQGLNLVMEEGLRGLGFPVSIMWAELGGLAVTIISLLILLPNMGMVGSAIASVLGYGTVAILLLIQIRLLSGYSLIALLRPSREEIFSIWQRVKVLTTTVFARQRANL